jgi:large subunit ribosomal protein L25
LESTLHHGGFSQLVEVNVQGGGKHNVLVREIQRHPVSHAYIHVDLYAVNMSEKQYTSVPVVGIGRPAAMVGGLTMLQERDVVEIEALPADIPASIEVDVTELSLERPITIADLPTIEGVTYLDEPHEHLFTMLAPRVEEEVEEEPVEEEAEPEVVGRGKEDEDEEEEE